MLRTWLKNQQIEHQKTLIRSLNFTFIIEFWAKMLLSKHKSHNCVAVSDFHAERTGSNQVPPGPSLPFFLTFSTANWYSTIVYMFFELYSVLMCTEIGARAKVSFKHYSLCHGMHAVCSIQWPIILHLLHTDKFPVSNKTSHDIM